MTARAFAWAATALVLGGVLTAWADPIAGHCLDAALLALSAIWMVRNGIRGGIHWLLLPLVFVCAWGLLQLALRLTVYRYETWNALSHWLSGAAVLSLAFATLKEERIRNAVLSAILCCGALLSTVGMIQWFTSEGRVLWFVPTAYRDEVMGTFLNRDHYAVFVELVLPISLTRALHGFKPKYLYVLASGFLYTSVVGSGSRAGAGLVTLEAIVILAMALLRSARNCRTVLAMAAGMAFCSLAAGWQYVWFRFHAADLFAFRREMALATLQMIRARPLTGFGLGAWPAAYPAFAVFDPPGFYMNHAHNDWLEWMAEGGIPVSIALLFVACGATLLGGRHWWALGVPLAFAHATVDFPLQKPAIAALAFLLLGAAAAANHTQKDFEKIRHARPLHC